MTSEHRPARSRDDYTVACICPMEIELRAVVAMLDENHESLPTSRDQNAYVLGAIGKHNIVVVVMPEVGNNTAAAVATQLCNDFPAVRFGLLVGIGGGVPGDNGNDDIRLGDVVVSQPTAGFGGVIQYDIGKRLTGGGFERTGQLRAPPAVLSANVRRLKVQHLLQGSKIPAHLEMMMQKYPQMQGQCTLPAAELDQLFQSSYEHRAGVTCQQCDSRCTIFRPTRTNREPRVHYGTIGSANTVVKDPMIRDELKRNCQVLCVEMEAAGLMDSFPCLVIRGICDYADSHKNKIWQAYAATVAAAYMKELLLNIPAQQVMQAAKAASSTDMPPVTSNACSLGSAPQINQTLFKARGAEGIELGANLLLKSYEAHFWGLLTVQGLTAYERLFEILQKEMHNNVSYAEFRNKFGQSGRWEVAKIDKTWITVVNACIRWDKDVNAWAQRDVDFKDVLLPQNLILACLYMLHVQQVYPDKQPNSLSSPSVGISKFRWWMMTKFGYWVPCACGCGGEWNFGGRQGIRRGSRTQHCKALSSPQAWPPLGVKRYLEVDDLTKSNEAAFFNRPRHKPILRPSSSQLSR